ncbi:glucose-6-phosphate isomerase [Pseudoxanthomonas sp. LjRoot125]|uniref:glucose-6-phosphate isomerase n=1 Tax=Pseudoxanthomonas sp. LjRoot125 TaxID=3342258 RepID=UPI003E119378
MSIGSDALNAHAARLRGTPLSELLTREPGRVTANTLRTGPLYFNFARQSYDAQAWQALLAQAQAADLAGAFRRLFDGEKVNVTEGRSALHTALRGQHSDAVVAREAYASALDVRQRMASLIAQLEATGVTDIVSVGIGGSDLGPRLVADALRDPLPGRFRVHFLSNVDGAAAQRTLAPLDPARTAAILISKTFGTQETLLNGGILRDWLGGSERLYAVSANPERAAAAFDIAPERVLPMWDWVGGRYSLWSAVGLPIALAIGFDRFERLLAGASAFDAHAIGAPLADNIAVRHALTAVWNRNVLGHAAQGVMTYDQRLALLPAYLQQLVMESLGKSVKLDGSPVGVDTVPVWWGGAGTDVQHSFFQALHQGTGIVPLDFVGTINSDAPYAENHLALLSNLLAQSEALANGQHSDDPHRSYAGGRPSTLILLDALTPESLGGLIAMYEHSVYAQSVLWGINAFDQFGVELGKQLANGLLPALKGERAASDPVTQALLAEIAARG